MPDRLSELSFGGQTAGVSPVSSLGRDISKENRTKMPQDLPLHSDSSVAVMYSSSSLSWGTNRAKLCVSFVRTSAESSSLFSPGENFV